MRLRPFTSNAPIADITDDPSQYFEDLDAFNEQDLFDNRIPSPVIEQPQQAIHDRSEFEELQTDLGIIYYETRSIEPDHNSSIPESQAETREQHPDNVSITSPELIYNEYAANERPQYHHDIPCHVTV